MALVRSSLGAVMTLAPDVLEVPYTSLQADTLRAVVEDFVTRSGTDYGARERTLEEKIAGVMRLLRRGEVTVVFDRRTDSVNLVVAAGRRSAPHQTT